MDNHGKYTINMNGTYIVISRIDNTVMYATISSDSKDTMKELLGQMGYQEDKKMFIVWGFR